MQIFYIIKVNMQIFPSTENLTRGLGQPANSLYLLPLGWPGPIGPHWGRPADPTLHESMHRASSEVIIEYSFYSIIFENKDQN